MKKKYLLILILFLVIGFASVSTTLVLNGVVSIAVKEDDFDVYFSKAILDEEDVSYDTMYSILWHISCIRNML